ncbi:hypothetical protein [Lysinibacillus fusiformis]|uniref:hypothetical protein n=1 Tax=Lysinibacillus fusiformis TaxID=28031 RepID=UPI0012454C1B|nr:hypothetical protein [Lysinibacillus fusiformis]KAB0444049.1 hypothetical protein CH314_10675 [Lysinibacillus fusiformis]
MGYLIGWGIWGILILLVAGILFWSAVLPRITSKSLSFVMISLGFNVISIPFFPFFLQKKSKTIMVCSTFKNKRSKPGISLFI